MLFVQTNNKPSYSQNKHAQWSLFPQFFSRQMCAKLSCANEAYACGLVVERDSTCNLCTCIILYFNIFNLDLTAVCKLYPWSVILLLLCHFFFLDILQCVTSLPTICIF